MTGFTPLNLCGKGKHLLLFLDWIPDDSLDHFGRLFMVAQCGAPVLGSYRTQAGAWLAPGLPPFWSRGKL